MMTALTGKHQSEMSQIVKDVFSSMLRMDVEPLDDVRPLKLPYHRATVYLTGTWEGAVSVECYPEQVAEFTRCLLGQRLDSEGDDAFGEIANMIGGNLKAVLPPKVFLSPPFVEHVFQNRPLEKTILTSSRLAFLSKVGVFWVTFVEFSAN